MCHGRERRKEGEKEVSRVGKLGKWEGKIGCWEGIDRKQETVGWEETYKSRKSVKIDPWEGIEGGRVGIQGRNEG